MDSSNAEQSHRHQGARRRVTLLFADICGSTKLGRRLEAEQLAEILEDFRRVCRDVAAKHGGRVARLQGDGALIVFGHPEPGEEDARRATEAALEIHERVSAIHVGDPGDDVRPLRMHSGIDTGMVLVSEGDIERGRVDVVGDLPNLVSALSKLAPQGAIYVSRAALGPYADFFDVDAPRNVVIDGWPKPLEVIPVRGRSAIQRRFDAAARRGLTPFVGRDATLAALDAWLCVRTQEAPRCALITGGAGIGKTRLLEEFLSQPEAGAVLCLRGYCERYLGAEVLQPFLHMYRAYHAQLGTGAPRSSANVDELLAFFHALAARHRLLLVIDDWQWADDASRQLLEALRRSKDDITLLLAGRPRDDGSPWIVGATLFELTGFALEETRRAARRWWPEANPLIVEAIHAYSGGVPLFVEELCHTAAADAPWRSPHGKAGSPTWLAALVASRVARLPPAQAAMVEAAAVIGYAFPAWLFERIVGRSPDDADVRALETSDFVFPDDRPGMLRFKHGITRDAVYEAVGLQRRSDIHLRVVAALREQAGDAEREDVLELLAYHARAAGMWRDAARYGEMAGDKAAAASALDRARAQYLDAIAALDRDGSAAREDRVRRCAIVHKLGFTCIFDPLALPDAPAIFERCAADAREFGDANLVARSEYWLGYMYYGVGRSRDGVAHCREALRLASDTGDMRLAAQVKATLGQLLAATCEYDESIALIGEAVDSKRQRSRPGSGMAIGSAYSLACKGSVLADRGAFRDAHECFAEAMELLGASTHPVATSVRNWIAIAHLWQGQWDVAERMADESARIAENTHALLLVATSRANRGYARWIAHGSVAEFGQLREAVRWMELRRGAFFTSLYYGWLVEGYLAQGLAQPARACAARLFGRSRAGEHLGDAVGCRALAEAHAKTGEFARAERYLGRAQASAAIRNSRREAALNAECRARVARLRGREAEAQSLLAEAAEAYAGMAMSWHLLNVQRLQRDRGDHR